MWEERSCRQTREWQHWGSGCYNYKCENGRLHIIVGNYSYECFQPGQELTIRILAYGWLHKGAVICPSCKEICEHEFALRGERCKGNEEAPSSSYYPKDQLKCAASSITNSAFLVILFLSILLGFR